MSDAEAPLGFDDLIDLLRIRLGDADALNKSELHSFQELMRDQAEHIPDQWYWEALEELQAQAHLHPAPRKRSGGNACGSLSADGRFYLRSAAEAS